MRIVHIVESFAGGVYDFLTDLLNNLTEYEHCIIYGKRKNTPTNFKKDFPLNTNFIFWRSAVRNINLKQDLKAFFELMNILRGIKTVDVLHLHSSKAGFLGRLAAKILGLSDKVVYTSHGASFLRKDVSEWKLKQFIFLERTAAKFGGKVIACSKSEAQEFIKYGINADYIYNGINCKTVNFPNKRKNLKTKSIVIGTIGRITYQKNPSMFNKIAQYFLSNSKIKFLWIGDGELRKELCSPNIEVTGWLSREEVFSYLDIVDIYFSTSLWEGLPLSVLQAMCKGKPLILSDCVGNRDLVKAHVNGFLYKEENEAIKYIRQLIYDTDLRQALGEESLNIVRNKFSLNEMIVKYKKLYKSLIPKKED